MIEHREISHNEIDTAKDIHRQMQDLCIKLNNLCTPNTFVPFNDVAGLMMCGILSINTAITSATKIRIGLDDMKLGISLPFRSNGIGRETHHRCFCCQGDLITSEKTHVLYGFVDSMQDADMIANHWLKEAADVRTCKERPEWIRVSIAACSKHIDNLEMLQRSVEKYNIIRRVDVDNAINATSEDLAPF